MIRSFGLVVFVVAAAAAVVDDDVVVAVVVSVLLDWPSGLINSIVVGDLRCHAIHMPQL